MKTIEEYMKLPYKMEIVEDVEEGISMNQYCMYLLSKNDAQYHWDAS